MIDMKQLMAKAQEMQQKMKDAQDELANNQYIGKSGGGLVTVTLNGRFTIIKLHIDPSIIKADDKDMLEDLIVAAYNDAKAKVDAANESSMSGMMGGLGLPPGFKMPF